MFHPCSGKIIWSLTCRANDGYIDIIIYICSLYLFVFLFWLVPLVPLSHWSSWCPCRRSRSHPPRALHPWCSHWSEPSCRSPRQKCHCAHPKAPSTSPSYFWNCLPNAYLGGEKKLLELARKIARRKKQTWITWINELRMSLSTYLYYHIILIYLVVDLCSMCSSI